MVSNPSNLVIYLVGPPGVGKYTVGSLLAAQLPATLVDNHHWLNPIFRLIQQDGKTPLPDEVWNQTDQVRRAVFETIVNLSPKDWNFVFTHAAAGDDSDREIASDILDVAHSRGADLLVVRLACSPDSLAARVASPERRARMKETDADAARSNAIRPPFDPGHGNTLVIDTTEMTANEIAERVLQKIGQM